LAAKGTISRLNLSVLARRDSMRRRCFPRHSHIRSFPMMGRPRSQIATHNNHTLDLSTLRGTDLRRARTSGRIQVLRLTIKAHEAVVRGIILSPHHRTLSWPPLDSLWTWLASGLFGSLAHAFSSFTVGKCALPFPHVILDKVRVRVLFPAHQKPD
jgi:hypothetical protein